MAHFIRPALRLTVRDRVLTYTLGQPYGHDHDAAAVLRCIIDTTSLSLVLFRPPYRFSTVSGAVGRLGRA